MQSLRPSTRRQMPDTENSRKTAEKGAEWVPGNVPVKQPKNSWTNSQKQSKQLFFGCFGCSSGCFWAALPWPTRHLFRLFFGCSQCRALDGRRDCNSCFGAKDGRFHRVRQRAAERGAQRYFMSRFSGPSSCSKMSPFYLKTCTPVKGNPMKHRLTLGNFVSCFQVMFGLLFGIVFFSADFYPGAAFFSCGCCRSFSPRICGIAVHTRILSKIPDSILWNL